MDLLTRISSFLAPKATAAGSSVINTAGMLKDYLEYNFAKDKTNKQKQLIEYNQKRNLANEALKQFGFDANKKGNQFDPVKYGTGTLAGAGELSSFASPISGGLKARAAINAVPGITDAIGRGENVQNTLLSGLLTSVGGVGGEKLIKGAGALIRAGGNKVANSGEQLAFKRLGLTKLDVNKFERETGKKLIDVLKENNLLGKGAEEITNTIDPIQKSFNSVAENSNLNINEDSLFNRFASKIDELNKSNSPEIKAKGKQLEEYVTNLFSNKSQDFSGKGITQERRVIDQLVKDFQNSGDAVGASKNRIIRDILQEAVRSEAEKQGIKGVGGKSLTELGDQLKKLYALSEVAVKRTPQPTGTGLMKLLAGSGGVTTGAILGGPLGAILGGGAGLATEEILNNPKVVQKVLEVLPSIGGSISKVGDNAGGQVMQKLAQQLGIKAGTGTSSLLPTASAPRQIPQEQTDQANNDKSSQNNQITPNNQIVPQAQQSQEQFDPNLEVTLTDGTKTTYGALQQKGVFQQTAQPQGITGGLDETKLNELALLALLTGNTKALSQIQAYQVIQEKMNPKKDEKALSVTAENKVQLAKSGLRALDEVEKLIAQDPNKVLKSVIPGKLGARDYDSAAFRAVEGLLRARSGAAIPETEVRRYMSANLPSIGDSPEEIKFKLSAFRKDLQDVANTGATTDGSEVLQKLLLGL